MCEFNNLIKRFITSSIALGADYNYHFITVGTHLIEYDDVRFLISYAPNVCEEEPIFLTIIDTGKQVYATINLELEMFGYWVYITEQQVMDELLQEMYKTAIEVQDWTKHE